MRESTDHDDVSEPIKAGTELSVQKPIGRRLLRAWLILWPILLVLHLFPIRTRIERELLLLTLFALWIGGTVLFWKRTSVKVVGVGIGVLLLAVVVLPGRAAEPFALRAEYTRCLQTYRGTTYVWGGEASTGIDCSGLIRVGIVDALLHIGLRDMNPALLREGVAIWWNDCSAMELGKGYGGKLRLVTETRSINQLDADILRPGDVAVTDGGQHVMAYIGNRTWIEADTDPMRVITATAPGKLPWFDMGMRIMRWEMLAVNEHEST